MKILVTGGAGFVGSTLVPHLLRAGHQVTVLDTFAHGCLSLLGSCADPRLQIVRGDARDEATVAPLVRSADAIVPLAAIVGAPACDADKVGAETTNVGAIELLARLASREQMIVAPISNSGYGVGETDRACTEDTPMRPVSHYGRTKVRAEEILLDHGGAISLRLATVFGASPRMRTDLLVNDFVLRAVRDRAMVIFEGHFRRCFLHVRDAALAFSHALRSFESMRDRPYNVGLSDANLTKIQLCERIAEVVPDFTWVESPIGFDPDKRDYVVSNERIEATGFRCRHSLRSGIEELRTCYQMTRGHQHGNG